MEDNRPPWLGLEEVRHLRRLLSPHCLYGPMDSWNLTGGGFLATVLFLQAYYYAPAVADEPPMGRDLRFIP